MSRYRITKLKVLANAENGLTNEVINEANQKQAEKLFSLGFISGGVWAIGEGDTYTGTLRNEPEVGKPVFLDGDEWFRSSNVLEVAKEGKNSFTLKTQNSIYRLEKLK